MPSSSIFKKKKKTKNPSRILHETISETIASATTLTVVGGGGGGVVTTNANGANNKNNNKNNKMNGRRTWNNSFTNHHHHTEELIILIIQNILSGLASAVALIPEVCTFAISVGLHPLTGLGSTIVLSMINAFIGGKPGLVTGTSATCAMILQPLYQKYGHLYMSLSVFLAGFIQILVGCTKSSKYIRVIPKPVMIGFVNGLSIKVIKAQIPHFQNHIHIHHHGGAHHHGNNKAAMLLWLQGDVLKYHTLIVLLSACIIDILPHYTKIVPSSLVGLVVSTIITQYYNLPIPKLVDIVGQDAFESGSSTGEGSGSGSGSGSRWDILWKALFPFMTTMTTTAASATTTTTTTSTAAATLVSETAVDVVGEMVTDKMADMVAASSSSFIKSCLFPPFHTILNFDTLRIILPTSIEMALVGLLQSLLTLQIIDDDHQKLTTSNNTKKSRKTQRKGKNTQETIAQGIGNMIVGGIFGGMGGSAILGQSLVNVNSGGTLRLSSICVSIFIVCGVTYFAPLLGILPVGALVGLMITVAKHTFSFRLLQDILKGKVPMVDIIIISLVTYITAFENNMVLAVTIGVLLSALRFAWHASCNLTIVETGGDVNYNPRRRRTRYIKVRGQLFFASTTTFLKLCTPTSRDRETYEIYKARHLLKQRQQELREKKKQMMKNNKKKKIKTHRPILKHDDDDDNDHHHQRDGGGEEKKEVPPTTMIMTGRETIIDFIESQVWDHAAIMAIESLSKMYQECGVKLILKHLSEDCREKMMDYFGSSDDLGSLSNVVEFVIDPSNDPTYLVGADPKQYHHSKKTKQGTKEINKESNEEHGITGRKKGTTVNL